MSKLQEYLKLIKNGLPNIDKILEGMVNEIKLEHDLLSENEQDEIVRRRLICQQCPLFSLNAKEDDSEYQKLFNKKFEFDSTRKEYCGSCGCPYKVKTASLSSECGLNQYNIDNPENTQELKWTKYK